MSFYAQAIDAIDWPLSRGMFYARCADCDDALAWDTPAFYEPDGDMVGDPPHVIECSTWLCEACGKDRGWS